MPAVTLLQLSIMTAKNGLMTNYIQNLSLLSPTLTNEEKFTQPKTSSSLRIPNQNIHERRRYRARQHHGQRHNGESPMNTKRRFIGMEKDTEQGYFEIAVKRIQEAVPC